MNRQRDINIRGDNCLIDESIAPYIEWLNKHGYHTIRCSSGNQIDHDYVCDAPEIQFLDDIISPEKTLLLSETLIETHPYLIELLHESNLSLTYFKGIIGNEKHKLLSLKWKIPTELESFMHILQTKENGGSEKQKKRV